ncbi:hypothetical protein CTAYLR_003187 [Chrysophaeum taylorii]|uniref:Uncharacterized protein n=1 Tax=Chrysophaeum taylorii TaxID=2483200 RepID=A0AAD7XMV1_9STRA|nr:hypothetical protein CTAYLR_003187 [Chrysophaeum taylorii]
MAEAELRSCWERKECRPERIPNPSTFKLPALGRRNAGTGLLCKAMAIYKTKWYERTIKVLEESVARYNKCALAYFYMGVSSFKADFPVDQRLDYYRKCVELDPGHADARYNLGCLLHDTEEAEEHYRAAIAANVNHSDAHLNLALLLDRRGDESGARAEFGASIETADLPDIEPDPPTFSSASRGSKGSWGDRPKPPQTKQIQQQPPPPEKEEPSSSFSLEKEQPKPPQQPKPSRTAESARPNRSKTPSLADKPEQRPKSARRSQQRSIDSFPAKTEAPKKGVDAVQTERLPPVAGAEQKKEAKKAETRRKHRSMSDFIEESNGNAAQRSHRVTFLLNKHLEEEEEEDVGSDDATSILVRAKLHEDDECRAFLSAKHEDPEEAGYKAAVSAEPTSGAARVNYGSWLYTRKLDYDAAEREYRAAVSCDPDCVEAHYNLAVILDTVRKDYAAAEEEYKQCVRLDPSHVAARNNYAVLLEEVHKDFGRAAAQYKAAMEADPSDPDIRTNYNTCRQKTRRKSATS